MTKSLRKIVALLLFPCLVGNPVAQAFALSNPHSPCLSTIKEFELQALANEPSISPLHEIVNTTPAFSLRMEIKKLSLQVFGSAALIVTAMTLPALAQTSAPLWSGHMAALSLWSIAAGSLFAAMALTTRGAKRPPD